MGAGEVGLASQGREHWTCYLKDGRLLLEGRVSDKGNSMSKDPEACLGDLSSGICPGRQGCVLGEQAVGQAVLAVGLLKCPGPGMCCLLWSWCLPLQALGLWGLCSLG